MAQTYAIGVAVVIPLTVTVTENGAVCTGVRNVVVARVRYDPTLTSGNEYRYTLVDDPDGSAFAEVNKKVMTQVELVAADETP